ncbi:MAG: hypothetical protein Kow00124_00900 [Anaerolineae bacterium]
MPPPRRPARGRDDETFFGLVTLGEGQRQPASFYEELIETAATRYFKTSGSATSALRKAIQGLNESALKHNVRQDEQLQVGLSCAILRGHELLIAVAGPARCMLISRGSVEWLPRDDELLDGISPLGVYPDIDVRYYRREVSSGDFLILADSALSRLSGDTLRHAVHSGEINDALNNLAGVAGDYASAEVIQFVSPTTEEVAALSPTTSPDRGTLPLDAAPASAAALSSAAPDRAGGGEEAGAEEMAAPRPRRTRQNALRGAGHRLMLGLAGMVDRLRTLLARMLPEQDDATPFDNRFSLSPTMQLGIAISVAVLVALITTGVYSLRGQTSRYAQLVREAQDEIEMAQAAAGSQAEARPHWEYAIFLLGEAAKIRAPGEDVLALRDQALAALDAYDQVTRVSPVLLREYEPGAYLRGPVVNGLSLYLIDTTGDILYREDLDQEGTRLLNREPQIIARQGELINNQVVGGLIDLVWMEDGGVPQRNVLATLTRNGLLITYSPSWDVTAAALPGFEAWQDPRAIAIYNRDLYVLDAGANEIWRYQADADSYSSTPQRYFTDVVPSLGDAIDLEIDSNGNVYVLHSSGQVSKYFFGRPEPFEFQGLPQPILRPTALFLNLSLFDRAMFVADQGGGRLYSTSLTGTFLYNYKDTEDQIFDAISGVYNQDRPPYMYITAGSKLYYFARP